jgi:hypothetical protein
MRPAIADTSLDRKIKSIRETVDVFCSPPGNDLKYAPSSTRQRSLNDETSDELLLSVSCTASARDGANHHPRINPLTRASGLPDTKPAASPMENGAVPGQVSIL